MRFENGYLSRMCTCLTVVGKDDAYKALLDCANAWGGLALENCVTSIPRQPTLTCRNCSRTQIIIGTMSQKLIVVVGATGNQGGSVARRFLKAGYRVRGLTRNVSSSAATALASAGVEVVQADLDDSDSLKKAFKGANVIFSVTNYWEPFFRPECRKEAEEMDMSCREFAYDIEFLQGKNISDAAATTVDSLDDNGFLASTLSHADKCSDGKFEELYHFDAKADIFPAYVNKKHPALAAKMSCIHTGFFYTSYAILPNSYFRKVYSRNNDWHDTLLTMN